MSNNESSNRWNLIAKELLKTELSKRSISINELKDRLKAISVNETTASLSNKLSRGSFSARFFLQVLNAIDCQAIEVGRNTVFAGEAWNAPTTAQEPALSYGNSALSWSDFAGFTYNGFDGEWYVGCKGFSGQKFFSENKVISLFTGAGGLDIGLERSGFETVACVEIDEDCKETLRQNRPEWKIIEGQQSGDIRHVDVDEILSESSLKRGDAALVCGGAPCQPFSNIGKRGGIDDEKNGGDLFQEFVRVVSGVFPRAFIFENVVGITQQKHKDVLTYMQSCLSGLGYSITYRIMNAADYGVPQKRNRFILLGIRGGPPPALPKPTHFKSVDLYREFCFQTGIPPKPDVKLWRTVGEVFSKITKKEREREDNVVMNISEPVRERMERIGPGQNFHVLPMEMRPNCWRTGKHQGQDTFGRLRADEPSVTIRTAAYNPAKGRYIHPFENRGLSSVEMAALQGFPKEWKFYSSKYERITLTSAGKQIGNAVPPPLAEAIGHALKKQLVILNESKVEFSINHA